MLYTVYTEVCHTHYRVNYRLISSPTFANTRFRQFARITQNQNKNSEIFKDNTFLKIRQKFKKIAADDLM